MKDRRNFMKTLALGCMAPIGLSLDRRLPAAFNRGEAPGDYLPYLRNVLQAQCELYDVSWGISWEDEFEENLRYACLRIKPATAIELAFVVAVSMRHLSNRKVVDEYVRRRAGEPSLLFDHPVLELKLWALPDTCRLPVFKEQLLALVRDTCDVHGWAIELKYLRQLTFYGSDHKRLRDLASPAFLATLTPEEVEMLEQTIWEFRSWSYPFAFCSTLAARAERLAHGRLPPLQSGSTL